MFHRLIQLLWTIYLFNSMIPYQSSFLVISSGLGSRRSIFGNVLKTHGIFVPKTSIRLLPKFGEVIDGSLRTKLFRWPKENTIEVKPIELTSFLKSIPHFTSAASAGLLLEAPHHALQLNLKGSPNSIHNKNNNPGSPQNYQLVDIQGLNGYHGPGHDQPFSDGTYPETLTVSGNEHSDDSAYLKNSGLLQQVATTGDGSDDELRLWKIKPNYQPVQFYELQSHQNLSPSPLTSSTQSQAKPQMASIGMAQVANRLILPNQNGQRQQGLVHNTNGNRSPVIQSISHHVLDVRPVFSGSENKPIIHPMIPCNPNLIPMSTKINTTNTATAIIRVPVPVPMMANVPVQNQVSQSSMNQQNSQRNQPTLLTKDQVQSNERKPEFSQQNPPIIFYQPNDPDLTKVPKNQLFPIFIPSPQNYEIRSSQTTQLPPTINQQQQQQQNQQSQQPQYQQSQQQEQQVPLRNTYESNKPTATITALTLTSSSNDIKAEPAPRRRPPVRPSSHVLAIERESARSLATAKKRQTVHNYRHHTDPSSAMEYENSEETDNYRFTMPTPDSLSSDIDDLADNLDISSDRPYSPFSSYSSLPHRGHDYNEMDEDSKSAASDPKGMEYRFPLDGSKITRSRLSLTKPRPRPSSSMSKSSSSSPLSLSSSPLSTSSSSSSIPSIKSHISIYPASDEIKVNPEDAKSTSQETSLTKSDRKTFDKGYERSKHRLFEQKVEELWKEKKWNNIGKEESEIETHGRKTEIPWISRRRDRRRPLYTDKRPLKYSDRYDREDENKSMDHNNDNLQNNDNNSNVNGFGENEPIDDKDSRKVEPNRNKDNRESNGKYNDWSAEAGSSGWRTSYRS